MDQHRVALVTGGTRGIGAAIVGALAADGIHVAPGYSSNRQAADDMARKLAAEGHAVSLHQGDVGKPEDCQRVVAEVLDQHGHIDYLINNAGITVGKTMRNMTVEDWHAVLRVNLSGAFYMTKAVLEPMIDRSFGRIVNISSVIGETGSIGQANYAAPNLACSGSSRAWRLRRPARASRRSASLPPLSTPTWWPPSPRRSSTDSSPTFRCACWVARGISHTPSGSCSKTPPPTHHRHRHIRQRRI